MGNRGKRTAIHTIVGMAIATGLAVASMTAARADAVAQGQEISAQAIKAIEAGNFALAADLFRKALDLRPNHPGVTLRLARTSARAGRDGDAIRALQDYAAMGLKTDPDHPDFKTIAGHSRMPAIRAKLAENAKPLGTASVVATIAEPTLLAEGIAHDATADRTYIGDVHNRRILMIGSGGRVTTLVGESAGGLFGVFALALADGTLWAASSALPQTANVAPADKGRAGIFAFDTNGRLKKSALLGSEGNEFALGDLAVTKAGEVYTSDSLGGKIYNLPPGAAALEIFIESDELHSPQGIALSADETKLAIADYSNGIHIIERSTKAHTVLPMPDHTTLHGIDALLRHGRDLIGIQNGIDPQRAIVIRMNARWSKIEGVEVLAANLPDMSEPTLATRDGTDLLVIGNGQWSRFNDDGTIKGTEPFAPTNILRLKLPAARP